MQFGIKCQRDNAKVLDRLNIINPRRSCDPIILPKLVTSSDPALSGRPSLVAAGIVWQCAVLNESGSSIPT